MRFRVVGVSQDTENVLHCGHRQLLVQGVVQRRSLPPEVDPPERSAAFEPVSLSVLLFNGLSDDLSPLL